jgi:hypothetical protein
MELLSDSMTLNAALNDDSLSLKNKKTLVNMCLYLLLKLAIDTGYTHSDFHIANLMMDLNDSTYFDGLSGKPSLIDFGFTQKLYPEIFNTIKTKCNAKQYTEALKELCNIKRPDGADMNDDEGNYGWVCGSYDIIRETYVLDFPSNTNEQISLLFERREKAIDKTVKEFDEKHKIDSSIPLLPLSNEAKNNMFSGLIGGRKNKNKSRKNKYIKKTKKNNKRVQSKKRKNTNKKYKYY